MYTFKQVKTYGRLLRPVLYNKLNNMVRNEPTKKNTQQV